MVVIWSESSWLSYLNEGIKTPRSKLSSIRLFLCVSRIWLDDAIAGVCEVSWDISTGRIGHPKLAHFSFTTMLCFCCWGRSESPVSSQNREWVSFWRGRCCINITVDSTSMAKQKERPIITWFWSRNSRCRSIGWWESRWLRRVIELIIERLLALARHWEMICLGKPREQCGYPRRRAADGGSIRADGSGRRMEVSCVSSRQKDRHP